MNRLQLCPIAFVLLSFALTTQAANLPVARKPIVAGQWWCICEMPDLGDLKGSDVRKQHIVDHGYSTISTRERQGYVILKTSPDLLEWDKTKIVSRGGIAGDGPVSAESPFVVSLDGYYYLLRASSITFKTYVYRSTDPTDFGIYDDSKLIATLPIKAPELLHVGERWYISDLADFRGIKLAKLRWQLD